ncbi:EAL domain-containing protein [Filobacillus milosensis]|uniref:EAL domain-containing protein n=1 Tax=Filobacillus milosensis TaxID=94137 RepID=A0A4Y8IVX8_9BACI|nr:EAL domain-containing protein [Filobacillus milosensis]TFB24468.1 EAL domain-containing protein [Filobacillus milosensis]
MQKAGIDLSEQLREAIAQDQFELYYQPRLCLKSGKLVGVEALIRWNHPKEGLIMPNDFIPYAEKNGLIDEIGDWVFRESCAQLRAWLDQGVNDPITSINLSPQQLYQNDLAKKFKHIMEEYKVPPHLIEIEITENVMMAVEEVQQVIKDIKKLGVHLSLDDFGKGYSALSYLTTLPFDKIKIDKAFVFKSTDDKNDETIVKMIIGMSHQLGIKVVAEGIEKEEHLTFLQRNLCDEGQGFFFSHPIPVKEILVQQKEVEEKVKEFGISEIQSNKKELEEALNVARQELKETLSKQQGLIFKYKKIGNKFIHTMSEGELLSKMNIQPEEVIGYELFDFMPTEVAERKTPYYERAWNGENPVIYEGITNGVYYTASLRPVIKGGEVVEVIGSCIDISERREIEQSLVETKRTLTYVLNHVSDYIIVLDNSMNMTYMTPSFKKVLGYLQAGVTDKSLFDIVPEESKHRVHQIFDSVKQESKVQFFDLDMLTPSFERKSFKVKLSPIVSKGTDHTSIILFAKEKAES